MRLETASNRVQYCGIRMMHDHGAGLGLSLRKGVAVELGAAQ